MEILDVVVAVLSVTKHNSIHIAVYSFIDIQTQQPAPSLRRREIAAGRHGNQNDQGDGATEIALVPVSSKHVFCPRTS